MYPPLEPYRHGWLPVGDGHEIYWEESGNPLGKPAVVVHGGPGSGAVLWWRQFFAPDAYRIVLFDQRNSMRSRPHASEPEVDLSTNTTRHLVADMETLRRHVGVEKWLVLGASWGSTLSLAYAQAHPHRVTEMVLFGVTTGQHKEFDWTFRGGLGLLYPSAWRRLCDAVGSSDPAQTCRKLLFDPTAHVREHAAYEWCLWESAETGDLQPRFQDPKHRLAFARIVTHYVCAYGGLEDGALMRGAERLRGIPGALINGKHDLQAIFGAWELSRVWAESDLVVVGDSGHVPSDALEAAVVQVLSRFASKNGGEKLATT